MKILGINCVSHDASVAVVSDSRIVAAVEEERYNRKKHTTDFPAHAIDYCLKIAGDVDYVGIPLHPLTSVRRTFSRIVRNLPKTRAMVKEHVDYYTHLYQKLCLVNASFKSSKIVYTGHHEAHMASAFFTSPFDKAAILSIDGSGDDLTTVLGIGEGNKIRILRSLRMPHSVGYIYQALTQFLGFKPNSGEGKIMGLAPYGRPNTLFSLDDAVKLTSDGFFDISLDFFNYPYDFGMMYGNEVTKRMGQPRVPESEIEKRHEDIAFELQKKTEEIVFHILSTLFKITGCKNLCLAGGVGLNSVMNGKITENTLFENIYVPSAPADNGTAIGSALWINHQILDQPRDYTFATPYLGPEYSHTEIEDVLKKDGVNYSIIDEPTRIAASLIAKGQIIGWFQGRTEFGARALGNRSILADPRNPDMKDKLNYRVKHREGFRPFAPSVLSEYQTEYFEKGTATCYMSEVFGIKERMQSKIPAVVHVDGTGRLQTVTEELNPLYHALISEFMAITGIPLVINTSFNVRGEPIVNSPDHALNCFLNTGLDALIIGNYLITKEGQLK